MLLTKEILERYVNGQAEIQNSVEGYLYRGEVRSVDLADNTVVVHFSWLARAADYPMALSGWRKDDRPEYRASLAIYEASEIGSGPEGGDVRLCLRSFIVGEITVFYPPNGSKLDPSQVTGLTPETTHPT